MRTCKRAWVCVFVVSCIRYMQVRRSLRIMHLLLNMIHWRAVCVCVCVLAHVGSLSGAVHVEWGGVKLVCEYLYHMATMTEGRMRMERWRDEWGWSDDEERSLWKPMVVEEDAMMMWPRRIKRRNGEVSRRTRMRRRWSGAKIAKTTMQEDAIMTEEDQSSKWSSIAEDGWCDEDEAGPKSQKKKKKSQHQAVQQPNQSLSTHTIVWTDGDT